MPLKAHQPPSPEEMAEVIRRAWLRGDISQKQVSHALGIHQSQFSKIVNGRFKEANGHAGRLFEYSTTRENAKREQVGPEIEALKAGLTKHLMRAWDGTPNGAKALEAILDGAARLRTASERGD